MKDTLIALGIFYSGDNEKVAKHLRSLNFFHLSVLVGLMSFVYFISFVVGYSVMIAKKVLTTS